MALISLITLDGPVTLEAGEAYGLLVGKSTEVTAVHPVATVVGSVAALTLLTPIDDGDPTAPAPGDHFAFGILGGETIDVLIRDIEPAGDHAATITMIPAAPAIHDAGASIPEFDPGTSPSRVLPPPVVRAVASDSTVMLATPSGTLIPRVVFTLAPIDVSGVGVEVVARPTGTDGAFGSVIVEHFSAREVVLGGLEEGETYDFRLFYTHPNLFASPASRVDAHTIMGRADAPAGLTGVSIAAVGGTALLRWDAVPDLDVRFGGRIAWRWSPETDPANASWPSSVSIGDAVDGAGTHAFLPLKAGTYLARVYDKGGRRSVDIAKAATKQASVLAYSPVLSVVEDPAFAGALTDLVRVGNTIKLDSGSFDDITDVDGLGDWDAVTGGVLITGRYDFAAGIDFGAVTRVRLTGHIKVITDNTFDLIGDWVDIAGRESMAGDTDAPVDAWLMMRQTDDDPAGSPAWGPWVRLDAAELECRGLQFRLTLLSEDYGFNLIVSELSVAADAVA